jgi:DNA gyrase subunit B
MSKGYNSNQISVLNEIDHIRLNPGMYIGETDTPTHLIEEVLDNSLDEGLAGFASIIAINISKKDNTFSIMDNGRGIPIDNNTPQIISEKMFSGAKFQHIKIAYQIVSGLHGIGLVAVNALSKYYIVEIYRDGQHAVFEFENSILKDKKIDKYKGDIPFSTKIQFIPNEEIFESSEVDLNRIRSRLLVASAELPNITFVLNVDKKREVIKISREEYFQKYCINKNDECLDPISIDMNDNLEKFNVLFTYSLNGSITSNIMTSINLLPVVGGGTHLNLFYNILKDIFVSRGKKLDYHFQAQDCFCGLRAYLSLYLIKPEFHGQTKDKLVNRKTYLDKLGNKLIIKLNNYFDKNQNQLESILSIFEQYRKRMEARKMRPLNHGKRGSTKFTKLRDCTSPNGELFIVEGVSASGGLIQCRDPRQHAILPLKGKIPNIINTKDILRNKEIEELIRSVGTGIGSDFDMTRFRYGKVIAASDADPDGAHITSLLSMIFAVLLPQIIKDGKFFIAQTPLFAINEKNVFIPLWDEKDLKKAIEEKRHISRFKGLGELSPHQLKFCLIKEDTRKLIPVEYTKNLAKLTRLFSSVEEKKKLLEGKF